MPRPVPVLLAVVVALATVAGLATAAAERSPSPALAETEPSEGGLDVGGELRRQIDLDPAELRAEVWAEDLYEEVPDQADGADDADDVDGAQGWDGTAGLDAIGGEPEGEPEDEADL